MPDSLKEHVDFIWVCLGVVCTSLVATGLFIFNGMRSDLVEVKESLKEISDALSQRLNKVERDLNMLWGEHRATHYQINHDETTRGRNGTDREVL